MCAEIALEESPKMKHPAIFSRHLRLLLPRYRNHQQLSKIQRIVKYCIIIGAVLTLFIITVFVHMPKTETKKEGKKICPKGRLVVKTDPCLSSSLGKNSISLTCTGLDLRNGGTALSTILKHHYEQGISSVNLILKDAKHEDNKMVKGWLNLSEHPMINSLTIDNKLLELIGEDSFDVMTELTEIVLLNTNLEFLMRGAFKGLRGVSIFSLRGNNKLQWVESGILGELFNLKTLQIEGMDFSDQPYSKQFFRNLTGGTAIALVILDLTDNRIPTFSPEFVEKFPHLISLYLIRNAIQIFEPLTFNPLRQIQLVHVSQNEIQNFPEEIFGYLFKERKAHVFIENNPIICDCDLSWLRETALTNNLTDGLSKAKCQSPQILQNQLILEVEGLCDNETTTTEGTTSTTRPNNIECINAKTRLKFPISPQVSLTTSHNGSRISVKESESSQDIQLVINGTDEHLALAYVCRECSQIQCQTVEKEATKISIVGLAPSTDYLICVFGGSEILTGRVDLQDCIAYRTQAEVSERTWIKNGDKSMTIVYTVLVFFVVFFFGALMAFLVVRKKPTLLRGSGRVEVVKSRNGELVLVMPERKATPSPSPSGTYDTISGYISVTPQDKTPPPLPPYPPTWVKRNREDEGCNSEDREYLEPTRLYPIKAPRNKDLLIEYEWYTQHK